MSQMSETIGHIAMALCKFQGATAPIPKKKKVKVQTKSGGEYHYFYADLADIWETIQKDLLANELAITQGFSIENNKYYITTLLLHSSGEWLRSVLELDQHDKVQELGSEITYLRRYGLSSILGIVTDEDEDGKLANDAGKNKRAMSEKSEKPIILKKVSTTVPSINGDLPLPDTLSDMQLKNLFSLVKILNDKDFISNMLGHLEIPEINKVSPKDYDSVITWISKKIKLRDEVTNESAITYSA